MPRKPRALVVAYNFPPHAAIGTMRTLRVVRRLIEQSWDVTVLTGDPRSYREGTPADDLLIAQVPDGVRIVRASGMRGLDTLKRAIRPIGRSRDNAGSASAAVHGSTPRRSIIGRGIDVIDAAFTIPDHESSWFVPAIARGIGSSRTYPPNVVYSSAPPWTGQLVAAALAAVLRCPWVADFRDPWARAPWRGTRFRFQLKAAAALERLVVRRADHILFVTQANRDEFAASYGSRIAKKLHVVPNGCDLAEFDAIEQPYVNPNGTFVLLHAGSLYAGRTPIPVLHAVADAVRQHLIDPDGFRLRFLGDTARFDIREAARQLGLERLVEVKPRVPRRESLAAMSSASALLLLQPGHTVSVPGKLYEYLAAGRPILSIAEESETADLVRSGGGVSAPPNDRRRIVDALMSVIRMTRMQLPRPRRELFDGSLRAAETVEILEAVARGEQVPARHHATLHPSVLPETDKVAPV